MSREYINKEVVVNEGGYPVKNARYWRRMYLKIEEDNKKLFERVKELEKRLTVKERGG